MNIGMILAGGQGKRMGLDISKQYYSLEGHMVLHYSMDAFFQCNKIDSLIFVIREEEESFFCKDVIGERTITKPYQIVYGGAERQDSVWNGLCAFNGQEKDIVVIHDGARPFVRVKQIEDCIEGAKAYGAVSLGMPVKDTIKVVDEEGFIKETPPRKLMWLTQTPQAFQYGVLVKAHRLAKQHFLKGTDDAGLVEAMDFPVKMLKGSYQNIKITTQDDLLVSQAYLKQLNKEDHL